MKNPPTLTTLPILLDKASRRSHVLPMTQEQRVAAQWLWHKPQAALQLVAGAGSGKTATLIQAVIAAQEKFASPSDIALLTFTRKAAHEMKQRLHAYGYSAGYIGTMHALAYQLLKAHKKFTLLKDNLVLLKNITRELFPNLSHIPAEFLLNSPVTNPAQKQKILSCFQAYKAHHGLLDFNDLVTEATKLPQLASLYRVLLVDEFQDTSPDQVNFIQAIAPEKLLVVGDDWQSIYSFRGAEVSISLEFSNYFPNSKRLFLTRNFRSTKKIVKLGNQAIRLSSSFIKKKLTSEQTRGSTPKLYLAHKAFEPQDAMIAYQKCRLKYNDQEPKVFLVRTNLLQQAITPYLLPGDVVMTIHAAKGLEFDTVVVYGIAEHILPHRYGNLEEEIRLLYVAITRAKKNLSFIAWESANRYSTFLPFLTKHCRTLLLT